VPDGVRTEDKARIAAPSQIGFFGLVALGFVASNTAGYQSEALKIMKDAV
jgi:hypothetical protein